MPCCAFFQIDDLDPVEEALICTPACWPGRMAEAADAGTPDTAVRGVCYHSVRKVAANTDRDPRWNRARDTAVPRVPSFARQRR